jgi:transcriptional regulator with XRE-family HTH domain
MLPNKIDEYLRYLRTLHNLTQKEVSERAGIPLETVKSHEQGRKSNLKYRTMAKYADFYGIDIEVLLRMEGW